MSFRDTIKAKVGAESYARIEAEAQREVTRAMQMPLKDKFDQDQYYSPRLLLREFQADYEHFQRTGLRILPLDIVLVLFRCRLLRATENEKEFQQRSAYRSWFENRAIWPQWADKAMRLDALEDQYVRGLETDVRERTLISPINSLNPNTAGGVRHQDFFDDLFRTLDLPLVSFLDDDLVEKHKTWEPGLRTYEIEPAKKFFSAPSFGSTIAGTERYCFWHGVTWLRTFLNALRVAGFVNPGQVEFSLEAKMEPPTYPVFLGSHALGSYQWREDEKESWQKLPDGCLFRSWGFRGLSNMWLDLRNQPAVKQFMLDHKCIFEQLKNPWSDRNAKDVAPILDILSSALGGHLKTGQRGSLQNRPTELARNVFFFMRCSTL